MSLTDLAKKFNRGNPLKKQEKMVACVAGPKISSQERHVAGAAHLRTTPRRKIINMGY
jgi:hypothetical protein